MKNKYRVVTDGKRFRIEIYQSWTYRCGWFFLKKITQEQWVPCDRLGDDATDEDGDLDEDSIGYYDSIEKALQQLNEWMTEQLEPEWKEVWQKSC